MLYFVSLFFALMRGKGKLVDKNGSYLLKFAHALFSLLCTAGIATQDAWQWSELTNGVYYIPGFHWTGWASVFNYRSDLGNSHLVMFIQFHQLNWTAQGPSQLYNSDTELIMIKLIMHLRRVT